MSDKKQKFEFKHSATAPTNKAEEYKVKKKPNEEEITIFQRFSDYHKRSLELGQCRKQFRKRDMQTAGQGNSLE